MGVLWISKVHFCWQIEKSFSWNGQKSCNETVSENTHFVAGFLTSLNAYNKRYALLRRAGRGVVCSKALHGSLREPEERRIGTADFLSIGSGPNG
jgi:hypothetical protein